MNKSIIYTIILSFLTHPLFAGGGWPQAKGAGYLKLAEWWIKSDQHFTSSGKIDPNVTSGIYNTSIYGEYGITDKLTVSAYIPFFSRATNNNIVSATTGEILTLGDAINSFGDTDLSLTYGLTKGKFNTAASITFGLPMGNASGGTQENLQTGDGEFNQLVKVDVGFGLNLGGLNGYSNVYIGFNNRTNNFSDEFRFGVEAGFNLFNNKLLALLRIYGVLSFHNGEKSGLENSTSIFANNTEHISISPELNYYIGANWGFSASIGGAVYGRLIFANPSYSVGVFSKF